MLQILTITRRKIKRCPAPMHKRAKVFSNHKKLQIFKAAKLALPCSVQDVRVCCLWIGWQACVRDVFCALCVLRACVFAWIVPNLRGCEGVLFVKDWREVSVCRRLCSQYAAGWPRLLTIQHTTLCATQCILHHTMNPAKYYTIHSTMYIPINNTVYNTMCSQYAGWPPLTPAISSVCHSAVTPSPRHSYLVGSFPMVLRSFGQLIGVQ